MTITQINFIKLLENAIFGINNLYPECNYCELEKLAAGHCSVSLVYQGAILANMTPPESWKHASIITAINNYKNLTIQKEVLSILNENNIPCAVIKGITAAVNYAQPMSRALGDVDILVDEINYEKAVTLFGYETDKRDNKFHTAFNYKGVDIEIHKAIDDYKTGILGTKLSLVMKNALKDIAIIEFDGFEIPCLQNEYQAVLYLNHMYRHFSDNELSMRMFCDWVAFVSKISNEEWNSRIYKILEEAGFNLFADALNKTAHKYMDAKTTNKINSKIDDKLADYLMEEFVYDGTRKGEEFLDGNIAAAYSKNGKGFITGSIDLLNSAAKRKLGIARYKLLLPICWLYIILRYFYNAIAGKRKIVSYKKIDETVNRRIQIKKHIKLG